MGPIQQTKRIWPSTFAVDASQGSFLSATYPPYTYYMIEHIPILRIHYTLLHSVGFLKKVSL